MNTLNISDSSIATLVAIAWLMCWILIDAAYETYKNRNND